MLSQQGLLSVEEIYTDDTKIEANAHRYTFVWKKTIQTNKEKIKKQLRQIWEYAQSVATKVDDLPDPEDFTLLSRKMVQSTVDKLNDELSTKKDIDKKIKTKLKYITKHYPANISKYEESVLGEQTKAADRQLKQDRSRHHLMRLIEDKMKNGQGHRCRLWILTKITPYWQTRELRFM